MREDRRNIDASIGSLQGEGAEQGVGSLDQESLEPYEVWGRRPSITHQRGSYYERPVIKEPVWIWAVPAYFYVGGASGAASVLAEVADLIGDEEVSGLVRGARWMAAAGGAVGTALLVYDLGRPERFLHMLRVFRPTSPMSIGSWVLAAAAPTFAASALLSHSSGARGRLGDIVGKGAGLLGLPLSGYTGVLLAGTAVPLWQETRRSLPLLFAASAVSSAAALLQFLDLTENEERIVNRFGLFGELGEFAAGLALERESRRVDRVAQPLANGVPSSLWKAAKVLNLSGIVLSLLPGRSRLKRVVSGLVGTASAVGLRFAIFEAGKSSARDPRATFELQRAR